MPNKSQSASYPVDKSVTLSGSWQRIVPEDSARGFLTLMNTSAAHNMGIYFAPAGNNNKTPVPVGIGSSGVFTMAPLGSYEPQGGAIPQCEVWVIGTAADILTAFVSS